MENLLKTMKDEFEDQISSKQVFSEQEKRRILNHIKYPPTKRVRPSIVLRIVSFTTITSLCAFLVFLVLHLTGVIEENKPATLHKKPIDENYESVQEQRKPTEPDTKFAISDNAIHEKIAFIAKNVYLGMSEEEVIRQFGDDYNVVDNSDSESGSFKQIGYNLLTQDATLKKQMSIEIDTENLIKRNIGIQLCFGFSKENKVIWTTWSFSEGDSVYMMMKSKDGLFTENILNGVKQDNLQFSLSPEEQRVYEAFEKDLDETHLKGLSPLSVAKLYIQAELYRRYDVAYALYTDRSDYIRWTMDEDERIPESDRGSISQTLKTFYQIDKGEFILDQQHDYEGFIKFNSSKNAEEFSSFHLVKDEDGIWNVNFLPLQ